MLMKAETLFPGSSLMKRTSEFLGKMMKEGRKESQSILSQDEEFYCSKSFLGEVSRIEKSFMNEMRKKRSPMTKKVDFNPISMFDLGINFNSSPITPTTTQTAEQQPSIREPSSPHPTINTDLQLRTPTVDDITIEPHTDVQQSHVATKKFLETEDVLKMFESQGEEVTGKKK